MKINGSSEQNLPKKKRKYAWLWILGLIVFFPIPLTILLARNKSMKPIAKCSIIVLIWIIFFVFVASSSESEVSNSTEQKQSETSITKSASGNIQELSFAGKDVIELRVGKKTIPSRVYYRVKNKKKFTKDDVAFVSDNPEIATISFDHEETLYLYYVIEAVSPGETEVYFKSVDGLVESEHIKVIVPEPIRVESVSIGESKTNLSIHDIVSLSATVSPAQATVKEVMWSSSDESVITVNSDGKVTAVGGGTAIVTATAYGGITDSIQISVDASRRTMKVNVSRNRVDDNNIGDEWSFVDQVNGDGSSKVSIGVGETIKLYSEYTESDTKPDVGRASTTHKVTEEDIKNGFEVSMDVYVKENGGRNKGKSAHFLVTYKFSV